MKIWSQESRSLYNVQAIGILFISDAVTDVKLNNVASTFGLKNSQMHLWKGENESLESIKQIAFWRDK